MCMFAHSSSVEVQVPKAYVQDAVKASLETLMSLVDGKAAQALKDFGLKRVSHLATLRPARYRYRLGSC